ncbi:glycine/serine hydroxymethyltransferase [Fontibacillus solani]|uniref:Glycine/serine hydroxymethyltransferase n=1 Tax=Fontibacillus solani TaxID=1572857 RepID=A0A7W3XU56_9BACL|nr:glycine/serine hydroxymethyltransferase [Fontibacillus solani]
MHIIAAKAVAFGEALQTDFKTYMKKNLDNANVLAEALMNEGLVVVMGGTNNHLVLVDLRTIGLTGKEAETILDEVGITGNKNAIPHDTASPLVTSGIRFGTPAVISRGLGPKQMKEITRLIGLALKNTKNSTVKDQILGSVHEMTSQFPLCEGLH